MPTPERIFNISPKVTWETLKRETSLTNKKELVGKAIFLNAQELCPNPNVNWDEVSKLTYAIVDLGTKVFKDTEMAIGHSFGLTTAATAVNLEWNMDNPQMVYMSGVYFKWILGKKITRINDSLNDPGISYTSEEARVKTQEEMRTRAQRLSVYLANINEALGSYANQHLTPFLLSF